MELYRKIYIKSEADLPKEKGEYYFFHSKGESILRLILYCAKNDDIELLPKYYIDDYDFWLQPIEITDADIEAEAMDYCASPDWAGDVQLNQMAFEYFKAGAKAVINGEIKHIEK